MGLRPAQEEWRASATVCSLGSRMPRGAWSMYGIRTCADSRYRSLLLVLLALLFVAADSHRALAADPTVAAVGDMACAATNPDYNEGDGTDTTCRQRYVSDLVANLGPAGLLDLGDNQYDNGS